MHIAVRDSRFNAHRKALHHLAAPLPSYQLIRRYASSTGYNGLGRHSNLAAKWNSNDNHMRPLGSTSAKIRNIRVPGNLGFAIN